MLQFYGTKLVSVYINIFICMLYQVNEDLSESLVSVTVIGGAHHLDLRLVFKQIDTFFYNI